MFAIIKINFLGSDDVNFQGFKIGQASSVENTVSHIESILQEEFEESSYMEISYSDNNQTTFESVEAIMDTISVQEISESEYQTITKIVGHDYGHTPQFLQFA